MRQTPKRGSSGNCTPDWKPVPKEKERRKKTSKSFHPAKGERRRQKQNPVSLTRSWRASAIWRRLSLSCKSKQIESNGCPRRGQGLQPQSDERLHRHAKRARPGPGDREHLHYLPFRPTLSEPLPSPGPNPGARHSYLPACSKPSTSHTHKQYHGRGSGHGTRPQHPGVPGNVFPSSRPGPTQPPKRCSRGLRPCRWGRGQHLWFA